MDDVARYNRDRWDALVEADALFTQPYADLDADSARSILDPENRLGEVGGKRILCVASGGGQQSIAFALLGADVTVFDLSARQLERDRITAQNLGLAIRIEPGDMRDLSRFDRSSFDVVWQPYSLNFAPDAAKVFEEVARVVRPDGLYVVTCANPFTIGLRARDWNGESYPLNRPYVDRAEIVVPDEPWVYDRSDRPEPIPPPREYRHTLSAIVDGLTSVGFVIFHLAEHTHSDLEAAPGSWEHFTTRAPPWLTFWTRYQPRLLAS